MEEWKSVVGYEGLYEVSNMGRLRSLERTFVNRNGITRRFKGRVLALNPRNGWYATSTLRKDGVTTEVYIHHLVMAAFIGPRPDGLIIAHRDDNKHNNLLSNLRYTTPGDNTADIIRNNTVRSDNISGTIGVSWDSNREKWISNITKDGKGYYLGAFSNKDDAIKARIEKQNELYP